MVQLTDTRLASARFSTPGLHCSDLFFRVATHPWSARSLLAFVSVMLFFYGIHVGDFWRTEGLRAIVAQEMLRSGDWIVPRLYGEPLFTKPPGMYLAIVLCSLPIGHVTEWSARLPSALAACACVGLFAWYFNRRLGRTAGLVAGLMLPMSFMWLDKATAAEIDMLQTAWITAAILFFFRAVEQETLERDNFGWWLAALLCMAGGVLTKWTAPEFFYGTAIPYLWWKGRLRLLFRWPHLVSAGCAGLLCLGWIVAAASREGWETFYRTVLWEGLSRLLPGYNDYRPYPWLETLFHPFKLLLNTLPWSGLALLALRPSFYRLGNERERELVAALYCWVLPQVLFWSLPTEHTPRHSFPLFPGIAGLAVMVWLAWHTGRLPWKMPRCNPTRLLAYSLALWLVLKVVHVEAVVQHRSLARQPRNKAAVIAALVPGYHVLYLFLLKDEGLMFYYGRPKARLGSPDELPISAAPVYCLLTEREWRGWNLPRRAELVQRLSDAQGDPIFLVRVF
jgi:4-amino-4-deoxy-L-arabinose transferase-like glycosyltransferase